MTEATGFQDSGTALLERVVEHYARCLARSESAQLWLSSHGISKEIAGSFRLGFCDRSYGNTFPKSNRLKGKAIREELMALGILRQSGHESLRGCLTVPLLPRRRGQGPLRDPHRHEPLGEHATRDVDLFVRWPVQLRLPRCEGSGSRPVDPIGSRSSRAGSRESSLPGDPTHWARKTSTRSAPGRSSWSW